MLAGNASCCPSAALRTIQNTTDTSYNATRYGTQDAAVPVLLALGDCSAVCDCPCVADSRKAGSQTMLQRCWNEAGSMLVRCRNNTGTMLVRCRNGAGFRFRKWEPLSACSLEMQGLCSPSEEQQNMVAHQTNPAGANQQCESQNAWHLPTSSMLAEHLH